MKKIFTLLLFFCSLQLFAQYPGSKYYPEVHGNSVSFYLSAPNAVEVKICGDFLPGVNEYNLGGMAEMKEKDGVWQYTAENLAPDFYFYYFLVDGIKVMDPNNLKVVCNYSEFYNTFIIEGVGSENLTIAETQKGTLQTVWYDSPEYSGQRRMTVYLPYNYSTKKKYPVLYMLPGGGDDEDTWVDMGRLPQIMDHMIANGEAQEMLVVMVNSMPNELAAPHVINPIPGRKSHFQMMGTPEGRTGGEFSNDLIRNIIPYIESHYSVKPGRSNRAVTGVSMGGFYLSNIIEEFPGTFNYIGFIGSGYNDAPERVDQALAEVKKAGYKLMWVGAGSLDMALSSAKNLMAGLDRASMPYTYYDSKDGHNWRSWRRDLQQFVPLIFR
jgi:enterochelin esterase family protein